MTCSQALTQEVAALIQIMQLLAKLAKAQQHHQNNTPTVTTEPRPHHHDFVRTQPNTHAQIYIRITYVKRDPKKRVQKRARDHDHGDFKSSWLGNHGLEIRSFPTELRWKHQLVWCNDTSRRNP